MIDSVETANRQEREASFVAQATIIQKKYNISLEATTAIINQYNQINILPSYSPKLFSYEKNQRDSILKQYHIDVHNYYLNLPNAITSLISQLALRYNLSEQTIASIILDWETFTIKSNDNNNTEEIINEIEDIPDNLHN